MSVAHDIAQIMDSSVGTLGTDIFVSQLPESPDEALAVYETGGGGYDEKSGIYSCGVTIKARAADYEDAYGLISNAAQCLVTIGDENSSYMQERYGASLNNDAVLYLRIKSQGEPYPVGRDSSNRVEFAQSFMATYVKTQV